MTENGSTSILEGKEENLTLELGKLRELAEFQHNNLEILQENIAELELNLEDTGWLRMSNSGDREFSQAGLKKIRRIARLSYLKNPLIKHAVDVQTFYVWGQGVSFTAATPEVNEVIQAFLDDPKNKSVFTGHIARLGKDRELTVHGDLFLALFTSKISGRVIVRSFYPDEIVDIITNPDDSAEPWYYKRTFTHSEYDWTTGNLEQETQTVFYPDWRLTYNRDMSRPSHIGSSEVMWDAPIYHVKVGAFGDMKFGVSEVYAALDWARAVKEDLENYASVKRALARFAHRLTVKGGKSGVASAKAKLNSTLNQDGLGSFERNPPPVTGATFIGSDGWQIDPIKTAGAQPNPDEGHRLWLMVSAGTGIPETILTGNADVGNLATAKTLDRPTELQMKNRQSLWMDVYQDILNYVIDQNVLSTRGALDGTPEVDDLTGEMSVILADEMSRKVTIQFPAILERDVLSLVQAITTAATLAGNPNAGIFDDRTLAGLFYSALGVENIDEKLDEVFPGEELTFFAGTPVGQGITQDPGSTQDAGGKSMPHMDAGPAAGQLMDTGTAFGAYGLGTDMSVIASLRQTQSMLKPLFEKLGIDPANVQVPISTREASRRSPLSRVVKRYR